MTTLIEKVDIKSISSNMAVFNKAANILKSGGLVAFPTETVYGLGANALLASSVKKIYQAKGRPSDNPLIVHISKLSNLAPLVENIPEKSKILMDNFWPGALTIIFKKSSLIPLETSGGLDTVAIRMPSNKIAQTLINACNFPIAAPSANISGKPSPTSAKHVFDDLSGRIDMLIDGGVCECGIESTIVDVSKDKVCILRPGSITKEMLESVVGTVSLDKALLDNNKILVPKAPGMKYKHYAPNASITIFKGEKNKVKDKINYLLNLDSKNNISSAVIVTEQTKNTYKTNNIIVIGNENNLNLISKNLFDCLRKCDEINVEKVYMEALEENALGFSIMNRLKKASGYNIVKV